MSSHFDQKQLPRLILVHGAAGGAWCWEQMSSPLKDLGFEVEAIDLPGLGNDRTPLEGQTFAAYVDCIVERVRSNPSSVVLVGHSMGGCPVAQAAEECADQITRLVYVAAIVPTDGDSMTSLLAIMPFQNDPSARDGMRITADGLYMEFTRDCISQTFYGESPPGVAEAASHRLRPQAMAPLNVPVRLTRQRYGKIPKTYIVCARDRALPQGVQRWLCERTPEMTLRVMDTDHSPFYSQPSLLAEVIAAEMD